MTKIIDPAVFRAIPIVERFYPEDSGAQYYAECRYDGVLYTEIGTDSMRARVNLVNSVAAGMGGICVNKAAAACDFGRDVEAARKRYLGKLRTKAEKVVIDALLYARGVDTLALADGRISAQVSELVSRLHGLVDAQGAQNDVRAEVYAGLVAEHAQRLRNEVDAYRDRWDAMMRRNVADAQAVSPVQGEMPL